MGTTTKPAGNDLDDTLWGGDVPVPVAPDPKTLQEDLDRLRLENNRLATAQAELRAKNAELDERVSQLISELAGYRRDRSSTYLADAPQVHVIADEWKLFRDQDFRGVARDVQRLLPKPENPADRRRDRARVRSVLARELVMRPYEEQLLERRREGLRKFLADLDNYPLGTAQRAAITALVEPNLIDRRRGDAPFTTANLWAEVGLTAAAEPQQREHLETNVLALAERAAKMVEKVLSTDPSGRLHLDPPGMTFDENLHDADPGGAESGHVLWPTFPRYEVGEKIIAKASAFVESDPQVEGDTQVESDTQAECDPSTD